MTASGNDDDATKAHHAIGEENDETRARRMRAARAAEQERQVSPRGLGASSSMAGQGGKELRKIGHVAVATVHAHDALDHRDKATAAVAAPEPEPAPAHAPVAEP